MKVLYFDVERGYQTLGSKQSIKTMFQYPVLSPSSWNEFQSMIAKIYEVKKEEIKLDVGGLEFSETVEKVTPKNNLRVDAVVIDTFSELSKKYQRSLVNKNTGVMKLQEWGKLKNKLDTCLEFISRIPGVVICTCHSKLQTMDDGGSKIVPYVDGSTKEDISKWFDFVFYTTTVTKGNKRAYKWVTNRTEKYDHAKDRTDLLDEVMDQDYQAVIKAAQTKGFENCRILIIGSPGSGKTWSLKTLVKSNSSAPNERPNVATDSYQESNGVTPVN
mgnify:CR=1 FL=1|tara:strand:+ start:950 stop:1768 length:819 start_codon:yes stop_codon:yes gene_type:complete